MTTRRSRMIAAAWLFVAASTVVLEARGAGQGAPAPRYIDDQRGLTIEDLVALALTQAPSIRASRARLEVARGEVTQAGLRPSPTASFEWRDQVGGIDNQLMIGVAWPLDLSRQTGRTSVAQQQVAGGEQMQADAERLLAAGVRRQAGRLLAAVRQLGIRERIADATRETRDLLAARAASGAGPPIERDVADVEWRRAQAELAKQRADVEVAAAELRGLVGLPPGAPLQLRDTLDAVVRGGAIAPGRASDPAADAAAIDARPDVRAAAVQVALASARTDLLKREARPDVSVTGSYWRMDAGFPQLGVAPSGGFAPIRDVFHSVAIGAMVLVPCRNRQQGTIAASVAAEAAARHDRDAVRLSASAEIEAARAREDAARAAWAIYAGGLRDLAAANLQVMRESHRLGRATLLEVLMETRRYLDIETACTEALLEVVNARVALASAQGVIK